MPYLSILPGTYRGMWQLCRCHHQLEVAHVRLEHPSTHVFWNINALLRCCIKAAHYQCQTEENVVLCHICQ